MLKLRSVINEEMILELIRKNVLCWRPDEIRFQNKLVMYAFRRSIERELELLH